MVHLLRTSQVAGELSLLPGAAQHIRDFRFGDRSRCENAGRHVLPVPPANRSARFQ